MKQQDNGDQLVFFDEQQAKEAKGERTYRRDMKLLLRHREWGFDCPAEDIDFLEYNNRKAVALVEYKASYELDNVQPNKNEANLQALCDLGNRASIPVFVVFYRPNLHAFRVFALNELAAKQVPEGVLSEYKYVDFLYWLKGRRMPESLRSHLHGGGFREEL